MKNYVGVFFNFFCYGNLMVRLYGSSEFARWFHLKKFAFAFGWIKRDQDIVIMIVIVHVLKFSILCVIECECVHYSVRERGGGRNQILAQNRVIL